MYGRDAEKPRPSLYTKYYRTLWYRYITEKLYPLWLAPARQLESKKVRDIGTV